MHDSDWKRKWAEMTDEERASAGIIIDEHILKHGKCYTVRGRDDIQVTIREDGFIAGTIKIANDKPMTCENFVRILAEFARAARYFEWTEEDREKGRNPQTNLMGMFLGWGNVPVSTFAEIPPPTGVCPTCGANHGLERHTEKDLPERAGQGELQPGDSGPVCPALPGSSKGMPER